MDSTFRQLLRHEVTLQRPVSGTTAGGNVTGVTYEDVYADAQPARIVPVRTLLSGGILGAFPEATHVLYCEPLDLKAGYRVERELAATALAQAAQAGDEEIAVADDTGLQQGHVIELSAGEVTEAAEVRGVGDDLLALAGPLAHGFSVGTPVRAALRYDVLGVEDEAGAGHHLRVVLRETAL